MEVLGDVFASLQRMTLLQLLFGFLAFTGYAVAQGSLFDVRLRLGAAAVAGLSALGFVAEANPWVYGVMLLAFAVAGIGVFASAVWLMSRMLGFARDGSPRIVDSAFADSVIPEAAAAPVRSLPASRQPAHSH